MGFPYPLAALCTSSLEVEQGASPLLSKGPPGDRIQLSKVLSPRNLGQEWQGWVGVGGESSPDVPSSVVLPGQGKAGMWGGSAGEHLRSPLGHPQQHCTSPSVPPTGLRQGLLLLLSLILPAVPGFRMRPIMGFLIPSGLKTGSGAGCRSHEP